jgi:hypothetical protein
MTPTTTNNQLWSAQPAKAQERRELLRPARRRNELATNAEPCPAQGCGTRHTHTHTHTHTHGARGMSPREGGRVEEWVGAKHMCSLGAQSALVHTRAREEGGGGETKPHQVKTLLASLLASLLAGVLASVSLSASQPVTSGHDGSRFPSSHPKAQLELPARSTHPITLQECQGRRNGENRARTGRRGPSRTSATTHPLSAPLSAAGAAALVSSASHTCRHSHAPFLSV